MFWRFAVCACSTTLVIVSAAAPWLPLRSLWIAALLVLPLAALATALILLGVKFRLPMVTGRILSDEARWLDAGLALLIAAAGTYLSNRLLVEGPFGLRTLAGIAFSLTFAAVVLIVLRPQLWMQRWVRLRSQTCLGIFAFIVGTLCVFTDATIMPDAYENKHVFALALATVSFAVACMVLLTTRGGARTLIVACLMAMGYIAVNAAPPKPAGQALLAEARITSYQRLLTWLWRATDQDGDGFSPWLGGGDCNDRDKDSFPLSTVRDCLKWRGDRPNSIELEAHKELGANRPPKVPHVIILLTIDAFRCGFGREDVEPVRSACPELVRLAESGRLRTDAHTAAPLTPRAIKALYSGRYELKGQSDNNPPQLVPMLTQAGLLSHAVVTHPAAFRDPQLRGQFQEVDETLMARARDGSKSTAYEVSQRVLDRVRKALGPGEGALFIWAHYFDPHAPYLRKPGHYLTGSRLEDYAAEVRRTDGAIGWLARHLRELAGAENILLVLTSDHGEEFGEHGRIRHGGGLYEVTTKIPMLAWSPRAAISAFVRGELPSSLVDVKAFLADVVTGVPFKASDIAFIESSLVLDPQVAAVSGGWKLIHHYASGHQELYDLAADPLEQHDRSSVEPDRVRNFGRQLARQLAPGP